MPLTAKIWLLITSEILCCSEKRKKSLFGHDTIIVVEELSANLSYKEDMDMEFLKNFLISIGIEILSHYILKWLDRK
jgi:hypothetical protein